MNRIAFLLLLTLPSLLWAAEKCPEPNWLPIPSWADPNKIEGYFIGSFEDYPGRISFKLNVCDPQLDNQGIIWTLTCQSLALDYTKSEPNESPLPVTLDTIEGIHYIRVEVADIPGIPEQETKSSVGTVLLNIMPVPENEAPIIYPLER